MGRVFRHPEPGEWVGDYRILDKIGSGGFGTVFKAERAGQLFALKLLGSGELGARERREIGLLLLVENPGVVRFRACDRWPDPRNGIPYIVTDFVPGMTLEELAEVENSSARELARILLELARTLGEVHLLGVFHRDLKPENILIPGGNARPVLIDFGIGTYVGAPTITRNGALPGTYEYRSPEAYLFNRANTELAHYDFRATDELWALGVTFYQVLTRMLPFGDRYDREQGGLMERVLHQSPPAPHVLNPRVPRALSDICMKMLEKKPEDRYASVEELCATLGAALADADASWDLPLFDPAPDTRKPPEAPARVGADEQHLLDMGVGPSIGVDPRPARAPTPEAPRRPALVLGLVAGVLGASLLVMSLSTRPGVAPPHTSPDAIPTRKAGFDLEVAPSEEPPDASVGGGAEPAMDSISTPVMLTMDHKDDTREKPQGKTKFLKQAAKALGTGLLCKSLTGCPAPHHQVRPTPEPAPCPAGAVETMEALGISILEKGVASFGLESREASFLNVREGDITLSLAGSWKKLPDRTLLSGRLIFGEGRVYGRLTEARVPSGERFKVCLEVHDEAGGLGALVEPDSRPENPKVFSTVRVRAVRSFE